MGKNNVSVTLTLFVALVHCWTTKARDIGGICGCACSLLSSCVTPPVCPGTSRGRKGFLLVAVLFCNCKFQWLIFTHAEVRAHYFYYAVEGKQKDLKSKVKTK